MKKTLYRSLALLLCLIVLVSLVPAPAFAATIQASGYWGRLKWSLDTDGVLTISGTGKMEDFSDVSSDAWRQYAYRTVRIVIEKGVTSISKSAFTSYFNTTSVSIPSTVRAIGNLAFSSCTSLREITIPYGVETIGKSAFYGCDKLRTITLPDSVTSVGDLAFHGCTALTSAVLSAGMTDIQESVFGFCSRLKTVTIPKGITYIEDYAFDGCNALEEVYYNGTQRQWKAISIGDYNEALLYATVKYNAGPSFPPDLVLPSSLTRIGAQAFAGGAFTYVKLSERVTTIEKEAFANCPNLKYIYIPKKTTSIASNAFGTRQGGLTIIGVSGSTAETFAKEHGFNFISA